MAVLTQDIELEPARFWPDDWRGTLAIIFGIGTVTAVNILAGGLVIVAATSHDLRLVPLALVSFLVGFGLGALVLWLVNRIASTARSEVTEAPEFEDSSAEVRSGSPHGVHAP